MTIVFAEDITPAPVTAPRRVDTRTLWLESFDGQTRVHFDGAPVKLLRGATGLTRQPSDPVITTSPGVPGGFLDDVIDRPRRIVLPSQVRAPSQDAMWAALGRLRSILRYKARTSTREGVCYLVGSSTSGIRRFTVAYSSGLEGEDGGMPNLDRFPLVLVAVDPYAYDRDVRQLTFQLPGDDAAFISDDPADTFETRYVSASTVFGQNMRVTIDSEAPVNPRLDFIGPFGPGLQVSADTGLSLSAPDGVPAGQPLTVITDPRGKSIRLGTARAAGRIARPWHLGRPFLPGVNQMDVVGPGATAESKVLVSWRGAWESLW